MSVEPVVDCPGLGTVEQREFFGVPCAEFLNAVASRIGFRGRALATAGAMGPLVSAASAWRGFRFVCNSTHHASLGGDALQCRLAFGASQADGKRKVVFAHSSAHVGLISGTMM